jgi:hypothetical protein
MADEGDRRFVVCYRSNVDVWLRIRVRVSVRGEIDGIACFYTTMVICILVYFLQYSKTWKIVRFTISRA